MKADTLKKLLQAGAIATDAFSKGSAGGLGKAIAESGIDLSGKGKDNGNGQSKKDQNTTNIAPADEQNTENAAGKKLGGQGNKRRNMSYTEIE